MNQKNFRPTYDRAKSEIELKSKRRPQVSEHNPVPLYRSYGVTKKETVFSRINEILATAMEWLLYIFYFIFITIGTMFMIYAGGAVGIVFSVAFVILYTYFVLARKIRKRAKFFSKLKKQCRNLGYTVEVRRSFLKGLGFNKEGIDFVVHTSTKKWVVRFMTPKKKSCYITFLDKERIEIKKLKRKIKLKLGIFGTGQIEKGKAKLRVVPYSFAECPCFDDVEVQKVLLVNPVPLEMFKVDKGGARIPIGTGERLYDYVMYSGTGFLNTLEREYNEKSGEQ